MIPLAQAYFCQSCLAFIASNRECPGCASGAHMFQVAPIWDRTTDDTNSITVGAYPSVRMGRE